MGATLLAPLGPFPGEDFQSCLHRQVLPRCTPNKVLDPRREVLQQELCHEFLREIRSVQQDLAILGPENMARSQPSNV